MAETVYKFSDGRQVAYDESAPLHEVLAEERRIKGDDGLEFVWSDEEPSRLESVGAGMDDFFSGVKQVAGEFAPETVTAITGEQPQDFTLAKTDEKGLYEQTRKASGQNGIDWWRIAGNVAATAPAGLARAPATLAGRMAQGAGMGAGLGYATFLPGTADGQTAPGDRLVNTSLGLVAGWAAPGLFNLLGYLGRNASQAAAGATRRIAELGSNKSAPQQLEELWATARKVATANGAEVPEQIPVELRRAVEADIRAANAKGLQIDPEALARKLELEAAGYKPRTGQVTRDQKTFAAEENQRARSTEGGRLLQDQLEEQSRKMLADLEGLANKYGAPVEGLPGEKGVKVMDAIEGEWKRSGDLVSEAYEAARKAKGDVRTEVGSLITQVGDLAWEGEKTALGDVAELTMKRLQKLGLLDKDGNVQEGASLTLSQLEDLRKNISRLGTIKGTTQGETLRAKSIITNLIDDIAESSPAGDVFGPARKMARERFQMFEGKALDDVLSGKIDPEKFFRRHVIGASVKDLNKTLVALESSPDGQPVAQMIRREMVDHILETAKGADGYVTAAGLKKGIAQIGEDKIKQVLGDDALKALQKNRRFAEWLFTEPNVPGGSLVNRSRTAAEGERLRLGDGGWTGAILNKIEAASTDAAERRAAEAARRGGIAPTAVDPIGGDLIQGAARRGSAAYNVWLNRQSPTVQKLLMQLEPVAPLVGRGAQTTVTPAFALDFARNQ